jgi:predicted PurR-regulated permease PerM
MAPEVRKARIALAISGAIAMVAALALYLMFSTVMPFIIAGLLASVLQPIVHKLESWMPWRVKRPALCRTLAILAVYALGLGVVGGVMALIVPPAYRETQDLIKSLPAYYTDLRTTVVEWNGEFSRQVPESIRRSLSDSLPGMADILARETVDAVSLLQRVVSGTLTLILGLIIIPMFLYYLLKDQETLSHGVYGVFPASIQYHLHHITAMTGDVVGAHMRSQLFLGVVVGTVVGLALFFMDVQYSLLLGVVAGITELIPILGPWLGALVALLLTLATSPEKAPWVLLLFLGVQVLESVLLVPRIQGQALRLHPVLIMIIIVVASQVAGIWGVIIGPPLVAVVRDLVQYFHREWHQPVAEVAAGVSPGAFGEEAVLPVSGPPHLVE